MEIRAHLTDSGLAAALFAFMRVRIIVPLLDKFPKTD